MTGIQPQVLIVGAGPTGLTAALELKRHGIHSRIIDRTPGPRPHSRALNINSRSLEILEPSGVTAQLLQHGNRLRRTYLVENGSTAVALHIEALEHRYPFTLIVPQTITDQLLIEAVSRLGIVIEWNTELMDLRFTGDVATVALATSNRVDYVTPDYLIAADGAYSVVRDLAGIDLIGKAQPIVFALADIRYQMPRDPSSATIELMSGGGAVASFPMNSHVVRHIGTSDDVVALMRHRRSGNEVLWTSEFHVNMRYAKQMRRGNICLAGDAAHISSPVGARSMNLGIEDAGWLAWLIARGEAAECYESERLPVARRITNFTRRQTYQFFKRSGPVQHFIRRYLASPLLALPSIEQKAIRSLAGLNTTDPPWLDTNSDKR